MTKQLFLLRNVKTSGRFFQNCVAFSEKLNFKISEKFLIEDDTLFFQKLFFGLLKYIKVLTTFLISNCLSELIKVWKEKYSSPSQLRYPQLSYFPSNAILN